MSRVGFYCASSEDTKAAGAWLGRRLRAGEVVLVDGSLGAGKTTFVQGLAEGYGLPDIVTSPTFALIHVYGPTDRQLVHVDPYRLEAITDAATIGVDEYLGSSAVIAVEWPERVAALLPDEHVHVEIRVLEDEARLVTVSWHTEPATECCAT